MGGNALTEGLTERKEREEYLRIKNLVLEKLRNVDSGSGPGVLAVVSEIVEMPEKQSFGDLDLLYVLVDGVGKTDLYALIQELFAPTEIVKNGGVTSFDFHKFQIDMIQCTHTSFAMTQFCLSYGDRGMILGQMAKCRGFSFGTKGLVVTHTSIEHLLGYKNGHISSSEKIVLSTDPVAIREFMGLPGSAEGDEEELTTQEAVMSFCMQSPWFRPEYFAPRKLSNCESKKKLRQRPFYKMFCDKIALDYGLGVIAAPTEEELAADLAKRLDNIREGLRHFQLTDRLEVVRVRHERRQDVRAKLDYKLFVALGIDCRSVGQARSSFLQWLLLQDGREHVRKEADDSDDILKLLPVPPSTSTSSTEASSVTTKTSTSSREGGSTRSGGADSSNSDSSDSSDSSSSDGFGPATSSHGRRRDENEAAEGIVLRSTAAEVQEKMAHWFRDEWSTSGTSS